jgi:hypothetical protein
MNPHLSGGAGWHVPFTQTPEHDTPQAPQLRASVARFAQTLPAAHSVVPAGHAHAPSLQTPFAAHAVEHDPQWARSLRTSTQADATPIGQTSGRSAGHAHVPWTQASPTSGHRVSQAPQWFGSDDVFAHAGEPGHATTPADVSQTQPPPRHVPAPQWNAHAPQFASSDRRSTHMPWHSTRPAGHAQRPPWHAAPNGHVAPHDPQFRASDRRSTQNGDPGPALSGQKASSPQIVGGDGTQPAHAIARAAASIAFRCLPRSGLIIGSDGLPPLP